MTNLPLSIIKNLFPLFWKFSKQDWEKMKNTLPLFLLIVTVYLLVNLVVPFTFRNEMIFLVDAALWTAVIGATILISRHQVRIWSTDKTTVEVAAIITVFQTFMLTFAGFFMGFGKNANVWTPSTLAIYLPYLVIPFLAMELSRSYLTQAIGRTKSTLSLLLTGLFFAIILTSIPAYETLTTPLAVAEFLIKTFIPNLAISILATYFAFLGRFPANFIYMAIPALFSWFSPIVPNPPWAAQSMITVIATTAGFLLLDASVKPPSTRKFRRALKKQKSQLLYWTAIALIGLIAVWSSTGLLGFTPTIIASGSMQPSLNAGDIVLIISAPAATIKVGDIIQYRTINAPIIHRVIDKYEASGSLWFITQGDANNASDDPVNERQVMGKAVFTIPKLGWVSIAIKEFAAATYKFLTDLPQTLERVWASIATNGVYIASALAFTAYSYLLLTYREQKNEKRT